MMVLDKRRGAAATPTRRTDAPASAVGRRTGQAQAKRVLEERSGLFDAALAHTPHGLCMYDAEKRLILCNPAYMRLYALPLDLTRPGTPLQAILDYRTEVGNAPADMTTYFDVIPEAQRIGAAAGARIELQDGRTIRIVHNPIAAGGYVATHEDITTTVRAEAQIRHLATRDALTGLPNRSALQERLDQELLRIGPGRNLAVLCLDLDEFKLVNDTLGHHVGDALLRAVAERLELCLRPTDSVARLGGDEFVVVQPGLLSPAEAEALASSMVEAIHAPFEIDDHRIVAGVSVGIAFCPRDGHDAESALKHADLALYRAKSSGRDTFRFFEPEMDAPRQERRRLERDLRQALKAGAFELHYQPLVATETGRIKGFEALLRWDHPERGMIPPLDFIPLAEETGLIVPIGEWVLGQACRDAMAWPSDVRVAINLSPVQFKSGELPETVAKALRDSGLPPSRLELEITESVLLLDNETTLAALRGFRDLGIAIALDDFGTGYSSLGYLRSFRFDKIKIDKSFILDAAHQDCDAIVKAVADLGHALGMITTAEGIESAAQLARVSQQGCGEVQGFFFSPPRPASEVPALLARRPVRARAARRTARPASLPSR